MTTKHIDLSNNPLLHFSGLPKFDQVQASHVTPAIEHLLAEGRVLLESLAIDTDAPTWDNFVRPLEDMEEHISRAWSQVGHMNAVVNSPELREAYNDCLPKLTDFYSDLSQDERLYAKYRALRASTEFERLSAAQRKIVENELRDFRLGGAELADDKKARFKEIQESLSKLAAKFEENLLDTTNDFAHYVEDAAALKGLPDDSLQAAARLPKRMVKRVINSPCISPLTCRCCNMQITANYARHFTVPMPPAPPSSANQSGITLR